jgi:hypothetical protein
MTSGPSCTAHGSRHLSFRTNLQQHLIGTFTSQKHTGRKRNLSIGTTPPEKLNSEKITGCAKVCALFIEKKKAAPLEHGI